MFINCFILKVNVTVALKFKKISGILLRVKDRIDPTLRILLCNSLREESFRKLSRVGEDNLLECNDRMYELQPPSLNYTRTKQNVQNFIMYEEVRDSNIINTIQYRNFKRA